MIKEYMKTGAFEPAPEARLQRTFETGPCLTIGFACSEMVCEHQNKGNSIIERFRRLLKVEPHVAEIFKKKNSGRLRLAVLRPLLNNIGSHWNVICVPRDTGLDFK
jgi:hypothetical protein